MSRWLISRWRTTTSAEPMAVSVPALSPAVQVNTMLFGAFSCSCGAPAFVAASASTTAGSGSQSTSIAATASAACSRVSAITIATPSPAHLTSSIASTRGVFRLFWKGPDAPPAGHAQGSAGNSAVSFPVKTAMTPGISAAAVVSIPLMRAWAYGLRRMDAWTMPDSFTSSR